MNGHEKSTAGHTAGMEVFICIPGMARFQRMVSSADHSIQSGTHFRNGRQQSANLGSHPYLCVVVQGIAQLGEYTKRDQHGRDKRYGIFSTVNWTLMYDVENHCYANESPGTVQVFHFKPKSHPLTTKQAPHILHYHCPTIPPFDLPENMPTPDEVKFK